MITALAILYVDAYKNNKDKQLQLNNSIPELSDAVLANEFKNITANIDISKYQSVIPIPFFHIGSENIWLEPHCNSDCFSFIFSLTTALPLNAVMMSRTSISQSLNNIALVYEPYRKLAILGDLSNQKRFLLLVVDCPEISAGERELISKSVFIYKNDLFSLYELKPSVLEHSCDSSYSKTICEMKNAKLFAKNNYFSTDTAVKFIHIGFDDKSSSVCYEGKHCFAGNIKNYNQIFKGSIPRILTDSDYIFSFWFANIPHDLYSRTLVETAYYDSSDKAVRTDYTGVNSFFKTIDNNWALAEFKFHLKTNEKTFSVTLWNNELTDRDTLFVDEVLIRPSNTDVYYESPQKYIIKNNRKYLIK